MVLVLFCFFKLRFLDPPLKAGGVRKVHRFPFKHLDFPVKGFDRLPCVSDIVWTVDMDSTFLSSSAGQ